LLLLNMSLLLLVLVLLLRCIATLRYAAAELNEAGQPLLLLLSLLLPVKAPA
jgi:hypothetical protein